MGNSIGIFGGHPVGTTGQLAAAIRVGVVGEVAIDSLRRGWVREKIKDPALFDALETLDLFRGDARKLAQMESVVARLLEDPSRAGYWTRAKGHIVGVVRFASSEVVAEALTEALLRGPTSSYAAHAYAGDFGFGKRHAGTMRATAASTIERDRYLAEGIEDEAKAKEALERLCVKAVLGDDNAYTALRKIATNKSPMADVATVILDRWEKLKPLAAVQNRLVFAKMVQSIVADEHQRLLSDFFGGLVPLDAVFGRRMIALGRGLEAVIAGLDVHKIEAIKEWRTNKEASDLMHNAFGRVINTLIAVGEVLVEEDIKTRVDALDYLAPGMDQDDSLLVLLRSAALENVLALGAKHIQLIIDVPKEIMLRRKKGRESLQAIVTELIHNAIKYSDRKKRKKWIRITWDPDTQTLTVADNGIGIKDTKSIWKKGHREAKDKARGSGEGLAIVKRGIKEMGGKIDVRSVLGEGTSFILTLPRTATSVSKSR